MKNSFSKSGLLGMLASALVFTGFLPGFYRVFTGFLFVLYSQWGAGQNCIGLNEICFEDVSERLDLPSLDGGRVRYTGQTWAMSWGDANGNEWPDLYLNHHTERSTRGRFSTSHLIYDLGEHAKDWTFSELGLGDQHSGVFIDLDRDGNQDILELTGGRSGKAEFDDPTTANKMFSGSDWTGRYKGNARKLDLEFRGRRGRTVLPINQNGILKLLFLNTPREDGRGPSVLVRRNNSGFTGEAAIELKTCSGVGCGGGGFELCTHAVELHVNEDADTDIVCFGRNGSSLNILTVFLSSVENAGFVKVASVPSPGYFKAGSVADFNNDGRPEILGIFGDELKIIRFDGSEGQSVLPRVELVPNLGANQWSKPVALVSGDFDNDLDVDFLVYHENPKQIFEASIWANNGTGGFTFSTVENSAYTGIARNTSIADFNLDGSRDVIFSDGKGTPEEAIAFQGGYILWQGTKKGHWLEVDLRDRHGLRGLGSRVAISAGKVNIMRGQYSGVHGEVQDFDRLHFGLNNLKMVDLIVYWADGDETRLTDVTTNQILTINQDPKP
ncbi:MAG: CRTAC1 family protein [Halioglobus sp.]